MNVSDNIRTIRTSKDLSQAEVARRYGTSPEFYHRLEKRDKSLTLEQVEKIANALEVSVSDLLGLRSNDQSEEILRLQQKNIELKKVLEKDVVEAREKMKEFEQRYKDLMRHMNLYEEMISQKRESDKKVRLYAKEVLASSGEKETQENLIRFIKAFFLDDEA